MIFLMILNSNSVLSNFAALADKKEVQIAMNMEFLLELWQNHSGKITGVTLGLLTGIMVIVIGFFQALFIMLCVIAGDVIGKRIDDKEDIMEILEKILPSGYHR